jgi:hypothetical protein
MTGTAWQCIGCGPTKIGAVSEDVPPRLARLLEEEYKRVVWETIYPGSDSAAREIITARSAPTVISEVPKKFLARAQRGLRKAKFSALHLFGAVLTICLGLSLIYFASDAAELSSAPFMLLGGVMILGGMSWGAVYVLYTVSLQLVRTNADDKHEQEELEDLASLRVEARPNSQAIQPAQSQGIVSDKGKLRSNGIKAEEH